VCTIAAVPKGTAAAFAREAEAEVPPPSHGLRVHEAGGLFNKCARAFGVEGGGPARSGAALAVLFSAARSSSSSSWALEKVGLLGAVSESLRLTCS
jgi:hypothetical protein